MTREASPRVRPFLRVGFVASVALMVICSDALGDLLDRYEASLAHWDKALEVAEILTAENRSVEPIFPRWILSQAKCLLGLGRAGDALTLLMAHRDVYDAKAPVNLDLEELRSGRV
jgi:hypothetical protein